MNIYQIAAWSVITGLALMMVGGMVLWAYGAKKNLTQEPVGPEGEAVKAFHHHLASWFFFYGLSVVTLGFALLLWGGSYFI